MIQSGLVSITFRPLSCREVVNLVVRAGASGIEWGGDKHVPHGQLNVARDVRDMTEDAGLVVAAYGSYYRVGHNEPVAFEKIVETAAELGAPVIRVWAGKQGSDRSDEAYRKLVIEDSRRIADLAQQAEIAVAYEFHGNTLTDTNASALRLLNEVDHPNMLSYWQPPVDADEQYCLNGLDAVMDRLANLHVFSWNPCTERQTLVQGAQRWKKYLQRVVQSDRDCFALIEFVKGDDPEQYVQDAQVLNQWLAEVQ